MKREVRVDCLFIRCYISSNVNEVIRTVLNSLFFLQNDFARTKSTKSTKSMRTQPSKSTKSTKKHKKHQKHKDATKHKHKTLQVNGKRMAVPLHQ